MDRFTPPSLFPPMIASLLAAAFFALAKIEQLPDSARFLLTVVGIIFAGIAFVTGLDWLLYKVTLYIDQLRSAWNAPTIRLAESVARMNHEQLAMMGMISPFVSEARMAGGQVQWWLHTPLIDIPYGWVSEYLEACELSYPAMLPQHGKPDALNRDYIRSFTGLMVTNGLAEPAKGNRPAQWRLPLSDVSKRLGLD